MSRKCFVPAGLVLLLLAVTAGLYLLRKDAYELNRTVRQVSLRILVYEELSLHRGNRFRFDFQRDGFAIFSLHRGELSEWRKSSFVPFPATVASDPPGFRLEFHEGRTGASFLSGGRAISRFPMSLRFVSVGASCRQRSLVFFEDGRWRPL